jgi:hypothetical protein
MLLLATVLVEFAKTWVRSRACGEHLQDQRQFPASRDKCDSEQERANAELEASRARHISACCKHESSRRAKTAQVLIGRLLTAGSMQTC